MLEKNSNGKSAGPIKDKLTLVVWDRIGKLTFYLTHPNF